jgi:hypothetical protein
METLATCGIKPEKILFWISRLQEMTVEPSVSWVQMDRPFKMNHDEEMYRLYIPSVLRPIGKSHDHDMFKISLVHYKGRTEPHPIIPDFPMEPIVTLIFDSGAMQFNVNSLGDSGLESPLFDLLSDVKLNISFFNRCRSGKTVPGDLEKSVGITDKVLRIGIE